MVDYLLIVLFLLFESFFSGSETGFYCVNRVRLRLRVEAGWPGASTLERLSSDPQRAISTMLVGTNLCVYGATVLCSQQLRQFELLAPNADILSGLVLPPLLLIFAEILPKSIFQRRADTLMYKAAFGLMIARRAFYPILLALGWLGHMGRLISRRRAAERPGAVTADKFRFFLSEGVALGVVSTYQHTMAHNILRLRSERLSDATVDLSEVVALSADAGRTELMDVLARHRFSRIPVYSGGSGNFVGVVNVIDVLTSSANDFDLHAMMRPIVSLEGSLSVLDALFALQHAHQQMAVVTDGDRAVGIATVKDLVEQIVGDLQDW